MLPDKITFVDLETTGMRSLYDRILEIGIIRIEQGEIVQTFQSLVNPQTYIPSEITNITGITAHDIEAAPTFRQIKHEILELLIDSVFVAHNVRFDYGFLKSEFNRENISFTSRHFCTVRLSRLLYPQHSRHNLDAIIQRFNLPYGTRHRAFDDAKVLFHFYQTLQKEIPSHKLETAINTSLKKTTLPLQLGQKDLDQLPEKPGVYIFYGSEKPLTKNKAVINNDIPLYIGKSINIKHRVLSHFSSDIHAPFEMRISQQINRIETIPTAGEIGALLLESQLIKKLFPLYNKKSRIKHELICIKTTLTDSGYQTCFLESVKIISPDDLPEIIGVFTSKRQAQHFLSEIAAKYQLCERLLGLEKTNTACFGYRLNRCKGACVNEEDALKYNMRFTLAFATHKLKPWPFSQEIIIEESTERGACDYFLIKKWCYLGKISYDEYGNKKTDISTEEAFDQDVYQIINQFLKKASNRNKIKLLSAEERNSLFYKK